MGMEEHTCLRSEPAEKGRKKKEKNPGINPGQPVEKRWEKKKKKKTLVLTLGSPLEKGEKKNLGLDLGFMTLTFRTWTNGEKK